MEANKIVWKRVRPSSCGPPFLRGYTGQWVSFTIHSNICGKGYNMKCMLPGIKDCYHEADSEDVLTKRAQDIFSKWFEKLMEPKE